MTPDPTTHGRPRWYASQVALIVALSVFASQWMAHAVPIVALYGAVGIGAAAGVVPWFVDWSQRRRGAVLVGGAAIVIALGSGLLIARLLAYLAAAVGGVLVARVREPLAPVLPALLVMLCGAFVSEQVSATWLASAVPFAASTLLFGVLRQRARSGVVSLEAAAHDAPGTVRPARSRYRALATIGASAMVALLVTVLIPMSDDSRPASALDSALHLAPSQPGRWLDDLTGDPEPTRRMPRSGAPPSIAALADELRTGRGAAVDRIARVEIMLRADVVDVVDGRRGLLSATALEEVLRTGRGTPEQKATVMVAVAQAAGYDARLVRGQLPIDERTAIVPYSWAELHFAEHGWVCVETTDLTVISRLGTRVSTVQTLDWAAGDARQRLWDIVDAAAATAWGAGVWALLRVVLGVAAAVAAAAIVAVVAGSVLRVVRRRLRRTRSAPADLIDGAWMELVDLAHACDIELTALTAPESVTCLRRRFGADVGDAVVPLAAIADRSWFAVAPPTLADARAALHHEQRARRALLRTLSPMRRWLAVVDPRPVLPRRSGARAAAVTPAVPGPR
jgi:hypothetical protein